MCYPRYDPTGQPILDTSKAYQDSDYSVRTVLNHPNMYTRLTIKRIALDTAGAYRLVVENGQVEKEEESLTLTVNSPPSVGPNLLKR